MTTCPGCASPLQEDASLCGCCGAVVGELRVPFIIDGRYEVIRTLGVGTMGVVHLARDRGLRRLVAVKLIAPEHLADDETTARFQREASMLASVRSDHVVQVFAFGEHERSHFFAMEYVPGSDLQEIISEHVSHGSWVPTYRALTILRQLSRGLGAVHAAGVIHRDVKPANVVVEEGTGRPVLVDFGLARPLVHDIGRRTIGVGTPWYMAPELAGEGLDVLGDVDVSPRTDVYSLACTAFEVLAGRPPFDSRDPETLMRQHARVPAPLLSSVRPDLARFDPVFERGLAKSPFDRFPGCLDFAEALDAASGVPTPLEGTSRAAPASSRPPASWREDGSLRILVIDDDVDFQAFVKRALAIGLKGRRTSIATAESGDEAVEGARRAPPHLVVLDYDMPGANGVDTLSRLRALPEGARMRVIVVSGTTGPEERWRFAVLGVTEFVAKPTELSNLAAALGEVANKIAPGQGESN